MKVFRRTALAAALLALPILVGLVGVAAPSTAAGPAQTYTRQAVAATNVVRVDHDLTRLRTQRCLVRKARSHARRMAAEQRLVHQDLAPVLEDCGLSGVGENIAAGYPSGRAVVREGWMGSRDHRRNILRADHRRIGLGAARDDDGRWWAVQLMGRPA